MNNITMISGKEAIKNAIDDLEKYKLANDKNEHFYKIELLVSESETLKYLDLCDDAITAWYRVRT